MDIESKDRNRKILLSWATIKGHTAMLRMLLDTIKVDFYSKDINGRIPLLLAAK